MGKHLFVAATVCIVVGLAATPVAAGIVLYEEGDKKLEVGARIQLQYRYFDPDDGEADDLLFFRRLRPYIAGTVTRNWYGKIQFDFGKSFQSDEVAIKDAYMKFTGFKVKNLSLTIGNAKPGFGREFLTSSKRQQLIERGLVGDHVYGTPDRALGLKFQGKTTDKKLWYTFAVGAENHDPDVDFIDFDTPVNRSDDWNEGWLVTGRLDFHPLGEMKFDQGNFHSDSWKFTISLAGYDWNNDGDNNSYTNDDGTSNDDGKADLDAATGIEISAGLRGHGVSIDTEYQIIDADTVVSDFTGGLYLNGSTQLDKFLFKGGYMVIQNRLELAIGWQFMDADNYAETTKQTIVGVNWFWNRHKAKLQAAYTRFQNLGGIDGNDAKQFITQAQFVF